MFTLSEELFSVRVIEELVGKQVLYRNAGSKSEKLTGEAAIKMGMPLEHLCMGGAKAYAP